MVRVGSALGSKVAPGIRELISAAAVPFVNMKAVESVREPVDRYRNEDEIRPLIKPYQAPEPASWAAAWGGQLKSPGSARSRQKHCFIE